MHAMVYIYNPGAVITCWICIFPSTRKLTHAIFCGCALLRAFSKHDLSFRCGTVLVIKTVALSSLHLKFFATMFTRTRQILVVTVDLQDQFSRMCRTDRGSMG